MRINLDFLDRAFLGSTRSLGARARASRPAAAVGSASVHVSGFGRQLLDRQELERNLSQLRDAAEALAATAPRAEFRVRRDTESTAQDLESTETVTTQEEVTTPATPARQFSQVFGSDTVVIAADKSRLEIALEQNPKVTIKVGKLGASLQDLAQLLNDHPDNGGRLAASVEAVQGGYRLRIETTGTGANEVLDVRRDEFKDLLGQPFSLIDPALAEAGTDEVVETVETTQETTSVERVVSTREIETKDQIADEDYVALVGGFVESLNQTQQQIAALSDQASPLLGDERLASVVSSLEALVGELDGRESTDGSSLASLGVALGEADALSIDVDRLGDALVADATSILELLGSTEGGVATDVLAALAAEPEPAATANPEIAAFVDLAALFDRS